MVANTAQHQQYLIDSIIEMEAFIDKIISKIYDSRESISDTSLKAFYKVIDSKKANIKRFKELLLSQYGYAC